MPTRINDKLLSWASDVEPDTIRQAEKTARLPISDAMESLNVSNAAAIALYATATRGP